MYTKVRVSWVISGLISIAFGLFLIYIGAGFIDKDDSCVYSGLLMLVIGICTLSHSTVKVEIEEINANDTDVIENDIQYTDIEQESDPEDEYELVEVQSYVRRQKKK